MHDKIPSNEIAVDDYNIIRRDRISLGDGLAIYLRLCYKFGIVDTEDFNDKVADSVDTVEEIWVRINLPGRNNFVVETVYRPPNANFNTGFTKV